MFKIHQYSIQLTKDAKSFLTFLSSTVSSSGRCPSGKASSMLLTGCILVGETHSRCRRRGRQQEGRQCAILRKPTRDSHSIKGCHGNKERRKGTLTMGAHS